MPADAVDGFVPARVNEVDFRTSFGCASQSFHGVRDRDETHVGDSRISTEDQQQIGIINIGNRVDSAGTEYSLRGSKFVRAVLGPGGEVPAYPVIQQKRTDCRSCKGIKCEGVTGIGCDSIIAIFVLESLDPRCDIAGCLIPADAFQHACFVPFLGIVQSILVVVNLQGGKSFVAGKALRHRMFTVRL